MSGGQATSAYVYPRASPLGLHAMVWLKGDKDPPYANIIQGIMKHLLRAVPNEFGGQGFRLVT